MATKEDALNFLDKKRDGSKKEINAIIDFLSAWVTEDGDAAERILTKDKSPAGAFAAMKAYARKNATQGCYKYEPKEAMVKIMEYYGVNAEEADQQLESGLMYRLLLYEAEKYKPYTPSVSAAPVAGALNLSLADLGI